MIKGAIARAALVGALGAAVVCALNCTSVGPAPVVIAVTPARGFTDFPLPLEIRTENVRPALRVDGDRGTLVPELSSLRVTLISEAVDPGSRYQLDVFDWDDQGGFWANTPPGLTADVYALEFVDGRGQSNTLAPAFEALGLDLIPPTIAVPGLLPDGFLGADKTVATEVQADDGFGAVASIHWSISGGTTSGGNSGVCSSSPPTGTSVAARTPLPPTLTCPVLFTPRLDGAGPSVSPLSFEATALDVAGNVAILAIQVQVALLPVVDSFSNTVGGLAGGQPLLVQGRYFLPGSQVLMGGLPIGGTVPGGDRQGDTTIAGLTLPHARAEPVVVEVRSPAGATKAAGMFNYLRFPQPRAIQPVVGPAAGGIRVTVRGNDLRPGVTFYVGPSRDVRQPLFNVSPDLPNNRVVGCLPPGTGTVSVWAYDAITGEGELPLAFTYENAAIAAADGTTAAVPDPLCQ